MIATLDATIYQAAKGFEAELEEELGDSAPIGGTLLRAPGPLRTTAWAINAWIDPVSIQFESLGGASMALLSLGKRWTLAPIALFDRAQLIQKQLPANPQAPLRFPSAPPPPGGAWTLAARNSILAAPAITSLFPNGEATFVEDKKGPPSRAYLKLWEALTQMGQWPGRGDRVVDLGSSPGGWTWALHQLGAHVTSVDKAPLKLEHSPRIDFRRESAFGLDPAAVGHVDWLVSDVICYPEKIARLIVRWLAIHPNARFVITLKFQGQTDMSPLRDLREIPGSRLVHLHHNRHELTWIRTPPEIER